MTLDVANPTPTSHTAAGGLTTVAVVLVRETGAIYTICLKGFAAPSGDTTIQVELRILLPGEGRKLLHTTSIVRPSYTLAFAAAEAEADNLLTNLLGD